MKRSDFEHTIRAAGAVLGATEVIVIGSQALHAVIDSDLPEEARRSTEADIAALADSDGQQADLIDGSIGEGSMFHSTFGYYAHGVAETTAVLPRGWRDRLVRFETPGTGGVTALCLEPHDLWISKAVAGREKDLEFCAAVSSRGLVQQQVLAARLDLIPELDYRVRDAVLGRVQRLTAGS
jgi:hypothetical protein